MKAINKLSEPAVLTYWKAQENDNWQPAYDAMGSTIKNEVKESLMSEQGYLCCYCERQLTDNDSHIEHLKPQSDPAVDPLDYSNMLCSCQNQLQKGEPRHCGNLKDDWFDSELLLSPLDSGCEERFSFTGYGDIKPAYTEDNAASKTIQKLGLNIPKLQSMRANVIEPFLDDSLSEVELGQFVTGYLLEDETGRYGEFFTTIQYLFGSYVTA